ncbi:MAG: molybdenum cofactor guanylyltransferase MobA [Campylobacterota bacterium]|nr:molybdenum cofactor guanylyltransferase MobA [Campylobacterota bacterium]
MKHSTAVIFAGGKSSRMGQDKALLPFANYPSLSEYQYHKLLTLFTHVYLSTKENKFTFDAPLIKDLYRQSSPLVAIVSVFETLDVEEVFILSVDTPFVTKEMIEKLFSLPKHYDAVIAKSSKGVQPLCGIYRRSLLGFAKQYLEEDNHKLNHLLKTVNTKFVHFDEERAFLNLNTPQEYEEALDILPMNH